MKGSSLFISGVLALIAALPASSNYQLNSYGFGSGATAGSSSTKYSVNGSLGQVSGSSSSTNYSIGAGENYEKQADVPTITLTNVNNWYNKLLFVVGPQANPSDAKYAIAISSDNFATTQYIQYDFTVSSSLVYSDYLTYSAWGGASGSIVRGLNPSTVYSVKAKALKGQFTESAYGPVATATTANPQLGFEIDVSAIDTTTSPPYTIDLGNLPVSTVTASPQRVWVTLNTNGESGGNVYISGQNAGLKSAAGAYTIPSQTADLDASAQGFGAQGASATQTSGGPFNLVSPYNGSGNNVGVADTVLRQIFSTAYPVNAGRGSFFLKAKPQSLTPASADYSELITAIASGSY